MKQDIPTLCMVGLGYIGLPTAAVFSRGGVPVIGLDVNAEAVATINAGRVHIVEPGLEDLVRNMVEAGRLRASTEPEPADAFLIAVPTPFKDDHVPDLSYIEAASRMIAPVLEKGNLVVLESTSPVGATETMVTVLAEARPDLSFPEYGGEPADIAIAHCPERILPGHALEELVSNDRVIGGMTPDCAARARAVYKLVVDGNCIETDCRTAEMAKLVENSFRDVNIAFANEISLICEKFGIDVWELISLANRHPRVNMLQPGPGVGGHCIAVDPWFIVSRAPELARLIRTAREINDFKPQWVIDQVHAAVGAAREAGIEAPVVACFGIAFKPNVDDLRESPALDIASRLSRAYPDRTLIVEPYVETLPEALSGSAELVSYAEALQRADVFAMLVDHTAFHTATPPSREDGARIVDTRGIWRDGPK